MNTAARALAFQGSAPVVRRVPIPCNRYRAESLGKDVIGMHQGVLLKAAAVGKAGSFRARCAKVAAEISLPPWAVEKGAA